MLGVTSTQLRSLSYDSSLFLQSVAVDGEAQQVGGVAIEGDEVDSNEVEAGVEDEEVLQEEEGVEGLGVTEEVDSVVVEVVVVVALEVHDNSLFNSCYMYILIFPESHSFHLHSANLGVDQVSGGILT